MKIFLLKIDDRRHTFYSEGPEEVSDRSEEGAPRGWVERKGRQWRDWLEHSDSRTARWARRVRGFLERFVGRDEPLLRGLRKTESVMIHHPESWTRDQAREAWVAYIQKRRRHHGLWLALDALMGVPSILLAALPGPNVVGYWFAYRVACHALALLGIRKVLGGRFSVWFCPEPVLDDPLDRASPENLARLAADRGLKGLDVFLLEGWPRQTVEPDRRFPKDSASALQGDGAGQAPEGSDLAASGPDGSPGAGREVGRCGF